MDKKPTLREKSVPKRCPWDSVATNGTLCSQWHSFFLNNHVYFLNNHAYETVPLVNRYTEIVPLGVPPYYEQSNSAPRGTVSVLFFLSVLNFCTPSR